MMVPFHIWIGFSLLWKRWPSIPGNFHLVDRPFENTGTGRPGDMSSSQARKSQQS
jgi:hypothetical protein